MSTQAVRRFSQSMPFGHSAIGLRSVSWVGVIADFASHRIGPRHDDHQEDQQAAVDQGRSEPVVGRRRSNADVMPGSPPRSARYGAASRDRPGGSGSRGSGWTSGVGWIERAHSDHLRVTRK